VLSNIIKNGNSKQISYLLQSGVFGLFTLKLGSFYKRALITVQQGLINLLHHNELKEQILEIEKESLSEIEEKVKDLLAHSDLDISRSAAELFEAFNKFSSPG